MTTVKFGWHMPSFPTDGSRRTEFVEQISATLDSIRGSFVSAWADDHVHPWAAWQPSHTDALECLTTLAYFAAAFPSFKFGSLVLCQSYRNPALVAKTVANLQLLTGGRIVFGIGAGWMEEEYFAYGYEYPTAAVRLAQLEETIQIAQKLWTESPATFEGKHYHIKDAYCEPKPEPIPPILIGGGGEKVTLRLTAQYADWWNMPGGTLAEYAHKLNVLRQHCQAVGREYDEIVKTWSSDLIAIAQTEAEAKKLAEASPYHTKGSIIGTPDQVAEQLRAFTDLGVEHFMLRFADFPNTAGIQLFSEKVIPQFL